MPDPLPPLVVSWAAERYSAVGRLGDLIAPPYDVISAVERGALAARSAENIVHVILPQGNGDAYQNAAALLCGWRRAGVLARDPEPAVYLLRQEFRTPDGVARSRCGVFAAVAAEPYTTRRVRPHERTHAGPKADRLALLRATGTIVEAILLLAPDPGGSLREQLETVRGEQPLALAELAGVRHTLWRITGPRAQTVAATAGTGPLYIADGHHRFETAVAYRGENPAAERTVALIVPVGDPGLVVLPTHRLVRGGRLDESAAREVLDRNFRVASLPVERTAAHFAAALGSPGAVASVLLPGGTMLSLLLRPGADLSEVGAGLAAGLDVARVDALVVRPLARLAGTTRVDYAADLSAVLADIEAGRAAAGVLLNPTPIDQVLAVADAGEVMPSKSTYFLPKVPSGMVMLPVK